MFYNQYTNYEQQTIKNLLSEYKKLINVEDRFIYKGHLVSLTEPNIRIYIREDIMDSGYPSFVVQSRVPTIDNPEESEFKTIPSEGETSYNIAIKILKEYIDAEKANLKKAVEIAFRFVNK